MPHAWRDRTMRVQLIREVTEVPRSNKHTSMTSK